MRSTTDVKEALTDSTRFRFVLTGAPPPPRVVTSPQPLPSVLQTRRRKSRQSKCRLFDTGSGRHSFVCLLVWLFRLERFVYNWNVIDRLFGILLILRLENTIADLRDFKKGTPECTQVSFIFGKKTYAILKFCSRHFVFRRIIICINIRGQTSWCLYWLERLKKTYAQI